MTGPPRARLPDPSRMIWRCRFVEALFRPAGLQDFKQQVPVVELCDYDPVSRTTSSVYLTFTYDLNTAAKCVPPYVGSPCPKCVSGSRRASGGA